MDAFNIMVDKAKEMCGGVSDAELARRINVTPQTLSQWRKKTCPVPDSRIVQIAHIAKITPELILVVMQAEQAKTSKTRQHWLNVYSVLERYLDSTARIMMDAFAAESRYRSKTL